MTEKLDMQHRHIMNLIERDRNEDGWAKVSKSLFKHLDENMPKELVIIEKTIDGGGRIRLTEEGQNVLNAMKWL